MKPSKCKFWVLVLFAFWVRMAVAQEMIPTNADGHEADTVALFAHFEHSPDVLVWRALARDLSENVTTSGWVRKLVLKAEDTAPREFPEIVSLNLIGTCQPLKRRGLPWRPEPLGWVRRVDGTILPFIFVNCDRVAEAVSRQDVGVVSEQQYAAALAKVIRHELRHILLNTASHECRGEYKASLSAQDLIGTDRATRLSSAGIGKSFESK